MFMIANDSSGAIPFGTLILIISIWTLVSIPLCFFGAIIGFKRKTISIPVRTNQIPRQVPDQVNNNLKINIIKSYLIKILLVW